TATLSRHLAEALRERDLSAARALVKEGAAPNTRGERSAPALVIAAEHDDLELTQALLRRGADVNASDQKGRTALVAAANWGHVEIADLLLRAGGDPNWRATDGTTPLEAAAVVGFLDVIDLLKSRGATSGTLPKATLARDAVLLTLQSVAGQRFFQHPTVVTVRRVRPWGDGIVSVALSRPHPKVREHNGQPPQPEFFKQTFAAMDSYLEGNYTGLGDGMEGRRARTADNLCAAIQKACAVLFDEGKLGNCFEVDASREGEGYRVKVSRFPYQPSAQWTVHLSRSMQVQRRLAQ
ncbi:MAG TPA: ankyrin repeat domain-containing protein, partial [Armatimonadota bacterium]|nr:ankyrin repeat domain-containing protein [Armatimonadota bacterium]